MKDTTQLGIIVILSMILSTVIIVDVQKKILKKIEEIKK